VTDRSEPAASTPRGPPVEDPSSANRRGLATALALPVHVISLAVAFAGVYALAATWYHVGATLVALLCFLLAWELRPRLGRRPKDVAPRARLAGLYGLVDQISDALGTRRIDGITLSPWFEASTDRAGIHRRAYISLGVPLVTILEPQELVCLIAHEVAHLANRDPRRTLILGTALDTLDTWDTILQSFESSEPFADWLWGIVRFVPWHLVDAHRRLLLWLALQDSRRAELLADQLGSEIGGSRGSASVLRKAMLDEEFRRAGMGAALEGDPVSFFDDFRRRAASLVSTGALPEPDASTSVDSTHPPTALRISKLEQTLMDPRVSLSLSRSEEINRSIRPFEEPLAADVIDSFRDRHRRGSDRARRRGLVYSPRVTVLGGELAVPCTRDPLQRG
jgi:Zn-dependent protease with chaperone function